MSSTGVEHERVFPVERCSRHPELIPEYRVKRAVRGVVYQLQCLKASCCRGVGGLWQPAELPQQLAQAARWWRTKPQPNSKRRKYLAFKRSRLWRNLCLQADARDGSTCRCGEPRTEHHQTEYPEDLRWTRLWMLVCICTDCHDEIHGRRAAA